MLSHPHVWLGKLGYIKPLLLERYLPYQYQDLDNKELLLNSQTTHPKTPLSPPNRQFPVRRGEESLTLDGDSNDADNRVTATRASNSDRQRWWKYSSGQRRSSKVNARSALNSRRERQKHAAWPFAAYSIIVVYSLDGQFRVRRSFICTSHTNDWFLNVRCRNLRDAYCSQERKKEKETNHGVKI